MNINLKDIKLILIGCINNILNKTLFGHKLESHDNNRSRKPLFPRQIHFSCLKELSCGWVWIIYVSDADKENLSSAKNQLLTWLTRYIKLSHLILFGNENFCTTSYRYIIMLNIFSSFLCCHHVFSGDLKNLVKINVCHLF